VRFLTIQISPHVQQKKLNCGSAALRAGMVSVRDDWQRGQSGPGSRVGTAMLSLVCYQGYTKSEHRFSVLVCGGVCVMAMGPRAGIVTIAQRGKEIVGPIRQGNPSRVVTRTTRCVAARRWASSTVDRRALDRWRKGSRTQNANVYLRTRPEDGRA
jgi:hypothetical protein